MSVRLLVCFDLDFTLLFRPECLGEIPFEMDGVIKTQGFPPLWLRPGTLEVLRLVKEFADLAVLSNRAGEDGWFAVEAINALAQEELLPSPGSPYCVIRRDGETFLDKSLQRTFPDRWPRVILVDDDLQRFHAINHGHLVPAIVINDFHQDYLYGLKERILPILQAANESQELPTTILDLVFPHRERYDNLLQDALVSQMTHLARTDHQPPLRHFLPLDKSLHRHLNEADYEKLPCQQLLLHPYTHDYLGIDRLAPWGRNRTWEEWMQSNRHKLTNDRFHLPREQVTEGTRPRTLSGC